MENEEEDLLDNLIAAMIEFDEASNKAIKESIEFIKIIEGGGEINDRQKHLVYYHIKGNERIFGEYKNEVVKNYFKDFVPEPYPWVK